ncbi:hypothetical protein COLO4_05119 [Corchorus olitorius]|uniref:TF-B3 domain-containing protein n=1 Tax=Corchorus olitorius TaxID=93759 RepID=A0A1R3KRT6_9ROSI|nr:hypothetical protein COLO4_05119 [Corchorus olitorius]
MDPKLLIFWSLFSPAKTTLQENEAADVGGKESNPNVCLELSLSCDYSCNRTDGKKKKIKNKSQSNISLQLSLSSFPSKGKGISLQGFQEKHNAKNRRELGLSLSLKPPLGFDKTSKKRERAENNSGGVSSNKRMKAEETSQQLVVLERRRDDDDPWCIKKKLSSSDLGGNSRLLLGSDCVASHILPFWNADQIAQIGQGFPVTVVDIDENKEYDMVFQKWTNGAHVLKKNWVKDFVKKRQLKVGDQIGLFWDTGSSNFKFSVLSRAPS